MNTDPRFTKDMEKYWKDEYASWGVAGKSPKRFVQSMKRIGTDQAVLDFIAKVLSKE